jgi:AraC-like DNA-binding protein/quercetin dioxygenase-like cupin family protein
MKPLVQKLPLQEHCSFVAQTFHSPDFETGWHQHEAYELLFITEGTGTTHIGKHEGHFEHGDIFFLGSNLIHRFHNKDNQPISAIVIQFKEDCWGSNLLNMPECRNIKQLLAMASYGLHITGDIRYQLQALIISLETAIDSNRIILLLQCLQWMASAKENVLLSTSEQQTINLADKEFIDRIFKYTNDTFRDPINLHQVASAVCMSVPNFCHYFKRRTRKTYINYLNEVRVRYACNQLLQTNKTVTEIGYESGYNTVAHFHRQFQRLKKTTPLQYRKIFSLELTDKGYSNFTNLETSTTKRIPHKYNQYEQF